MAKLLTEPEVRQYQEQGYLAPVPILSADEARASGKARGL